ncbi:uncharacterized protein DS421_14g451910 [Arachis hypogaea]|nr:uncharacterized protein DS421_14g451910 [Arachis hypogaea]
MIWQHSQPESLLSQCTFLLSPSTPPQLPQVPKIRCLNPNPRFAHHQCHISPDRTSFARSISFALLLLPPRCRTPPPIRLKANAVADGFPFFLLGSTDLTVRCGRSSWPPSPLCSFPPFPPRTLSICYSAIILKWFGYFIVVAPVMIAVVLDGVLAVEIAVAASGGGC